MATTAAQRRQQRAEARLGNVTNPTPRAAEVQRAAQSSQVVTNTRPTRITSGGIASNSTRNNVTRNITTTAPVGRGGRVSDQITGTPGVATPLPQQEREDARQERIRRSSGPEVVRNTQRLNEMLRNGDISQEQFNASRNALLGGAAGVNPLGFGGEGARRNEDGSLDVDPIGSPNQGRTERNQPGISSPSAGAQGRSGQLGFNPDAVGDPTGGRGRNFITTEGSSRDSFRRTGGLQQQIEDIDRELGRAVMVPSASGLSMRVDAAATAQKNAQLQQSRAEALGQLAQQRIAEQSRAAEEERASQPTFDEEFQFSDKEVNQLSSSLQGTIGGITSSLDSSTQTLLSLQQFANQNPDLAPALMPQIQLFSGQLASIEAENNRAINSLDDGSAVARSVADSKLLLKEEKDEMDKLNKEARDIALGTAELNKSRAESEKAKFEVQQAKRESEMREQNIENEIKNRRVANQMGIQADTNGLKWMQDAVRKGSENLAYLETLGDIQSAQFSMEVSQQYSLDVRTALNGFQSTQAQINGQFRKDLSELDSIVSLDAQERRKEQARITEKAMDRKFQVESKMADTLNQINANMEKRILEEGKNRREGIKEARTLSTDLRKEINSLDIVKSYETVSLNQQKMSNAFTMFNSGEVDAVAVDQVLITVFNKMLDETSVVRESEYARTPGDQGLVRGAVGLLQKAVSGGAGIDNQTRSSLVRMATEFSGLYEDKMLMKIQPQLEEMLEFNRTSDPDNQIAIERILNTSQMHIDPNKLNSIESMIADELGEEPRYQSNLVDSPHLSNVTEGTITAYGSPAWKHGLDIANSPGTPIRAKLGGEIVGIVNKYSNPSGKPLPASEGKGQNSGFGNWVVVRHDDGTEARYSHLGDVSELKKGQRVNEGDVLGGMGNTGFTMGKTGTHLDLTVVKEYKNGKPVYMTPNEVAIWADKPAKREVASSPSFIPKASAQAPIEQSEQVSSSQLANMITAEDRQKIVTSPEESREAVAQAILRQKELQLAAQGIQPPPGALASATANIIRGLDATGRFVGREFFGKTAEMTVEGARDTGRALGFVGRKIGEFGKDVSRSLSQ